MRRGASIGERLYRAILRLYPREFRERFGREMTVAFRDGRGDARRSGARAVASFWSRIAADAFLHAPEEHIQMIRQDVRFALRTLRTSPVFTVVAVATLALGIGANTAIFSVLKAVVLNPLPYDDPGRLVRIWEKNDALEISQFSASVPNYYSWREEARSFEELAAWRSASATLTGVGDPERLSVAQISASAFRVLRVRPGIGREFTAAEDRPGADGLALLGYRFWRSRFGGDAAVVGSTVTLDGRPRTVIGVLPADVVPETDVWVPLAADLSREDRDNHMMSVMGRLAAGVTIDQARQEMDAIAARLAQRYPKDDGGWGVVTVSFYDAIVPQTLRGTVYVLFAAVALVLLIACSNIASLLIARAAGRQREIAVRLALGATRTRLVRQVLTESLLLAIIGGAAGMLLAYWGVSALRTELGALVPRGREIATDRSVLAFSVAVSLATGGLFGSLPALFGWQSSVSASLKDGARTTSGSTERLRGVIVAGEVALATVLLIGAALLAQSFQRLQRVDLGFAPDRVVTAMVGLPQSRFRTPAEAIAFCNRFAAAIEAIPGVVGAGLSSGAPFTGGNTAMAVKAVGASALADQSLQADWRKVSPHYFKAMSIPILKGRTFDDRDLPGPPFVVIVSEGMARRIWPDRDAVGRQIQAGSVAFTIVGVAADVRNTQLNTQPAPTMYISTTQSTWPVMNIVVRTQADAASMAGALRRALKDLDPALALFNVQTMDALLDAQVAQPRLTASLVGLFALVALLLATIGLYGVLAFVVAQRTREIGVRMALGARPREVLTLVLRNGAWLAAIGLAIGAAGAAALGRFMSSQLYGIDPRDPLTYAAVSTLLMAVALLASGIPALRATRVDPVVALRVE
jgi:putative ABC transport system permease protein